MPEGIPVRVKCPRCGWVHWPVADTGDMNVGTMSCVNCHGATGAEFVLARLRDAPVGARILPIRIPEAHLRELGIDVEKLAVMDHVL